MKKNLLFVIFLVFAIIFTGCAATADNAVKENLETADDSGEGKSDVYGKLKEANKRFSWELFRTMNAEDYDKEIFMSPFSVSGMLMMAYNGAEGTTRKAMEKAMHYEGIPADDLNNSYRYLINRLNNIDRKVKLEIANSLWYRDGFEIKQGFVDTNSKYLFSEVKSLDFSDRTAADEINRWISKKTGGLIPSVINPPIPDDVMMFLINAIYFKGEWKEAFDERKTKEADFYAWDGKTDKVQMMQRNGKAALAESDDYRAVNLTYGDEKVAMTVILPNRDINDFINEFDQEKWNELLNNFKTVNDLHLQLPKFRLEYGIKELKKVLGSLGMGEIFTVNADFSGIADKLFISSVLHKAVVDVNEKGTEAAAVTIGEFTATAAYDPVLFTVNRPFLFVIYDTEEGNILFIGKKLFGDR